MSYLAAAALVLLVALVWLWAARRAPRKPETSEAPSPKASPHARPRFDTTIGEFHDLRDALRPLEHTRAASRTVPRGRR